MWRSLAISAQIRVVHISEASVSCAGTVAAMRPTEEMLAAAQPSHAQAAMLSEAAAVGAYDQVPVAFAAGVYAFDTASEVFMLHSAKVTAAPVL